MAQVMEPGSTIVATASLAGLVAMPLDPVYTLTKHAVVGFVRAVAPQLTERGITINALCPGFADTPIVDAELRRVGRRAGDPADRARHGGRRLRSRRRARARPGRHGSSSPAASRSCTSSAACRGRGDGLPHARRAVRRVARLPVRAALRRPGRPADALPRRGRRRSGALPPRRADLVVPVSEDDPRAGGGGPGGRARLLRLRPLGQADRRRVVHVRPALRVDRAAGRGARPARADGGRPGLGRADRAAARGRAARSGCAARDPEHGRRRRPSAERDVASVPRGRAGGRRGLPARPADPDRCRARTRRRRRRGVRSTVPGTGVEGGRARVPGAGADRAGASEHRAADGDPGGAGLVGEAGARPVRRLRPDLRPEVAEAIAKWIPGALPAELVEHAGHFVQEDAGEEVAARIVEFLR